MLQNCSIFKVAEVFFQNPTTEFSLIDVSRKTKLAHTSVKQHLIKLKQKNMIQTKDYKRGSRKFSVFFADINNKQFKQNKLLSNINTLNESNLIQYLNDKFMPKCIVLFGSYSKAEDIESSDIDLFIQCKETQINLKKFEKILQRKIELHFKENFQTYPEELRSNIANGICLEGYLEVYNETQSKKRFEETKIFNKVGFDKFRKIKHNTKK
ncbi:MAG: nucleotidyltransferase family protein [Candidatus Woesearchaeota archaeon]